MNKVIECGRLTRDPEVKYTSSDNKPVCRFTLAVDRPTKAGTEKKADFINVVAFGKTAEFISKYFSKGVRILVEGSLRNNNYEDKNGVKHYTLDVWVSQAYFADGKGGTSNNNTEKGGFGSFGNSNNETFSTQDNSFAFPSFGDDDDDLPF